MLKEKEKLIFDTRSEIDYQLNEINLLKSIIEELKNDKIKIFEEKSQIIETIRKENENIYKQLNKEKRKSLTNDSVLKNNEELLISYQEELENSKLEALDNEYSIFKKK